MAAVATLSLLPAFAAFSGETSQAQPASQLPMGTTMMAASDHASQAHSEHGESGHDEMAEGHHGDGEASLSFGHPAKAEQADRTVKIEALDIAFEPKSADIKKGETIKFVVANTGKLEHEFVLATPEEQKEHAKEMRAMQANGGKMHHSDPNALTIPAGETKTLIWTFTKAVPVTYVCHVSGHYEAGMRGDIEIL